LIAFCLCGGGSHNSYIERAHQRITANIKTGSTSDVGIEADWLEAMAFAWLAKQRLENKPGNVPAVTGASRHCILGGVYSARLKPKNQIEKDEPQPHVVDAFGLLITNFEPCNPSS
jgi:1,6-anhydro-N-acetylmuramate kinase